MAKKNRSYRKRITDAALQVKLNAFGATLIVGPKGCGKTTTAKQYAKSFIEFQDEDNRDRYLTVAENMPSKLLIGEKPRLFDEWQDAPKIWGAIRKDVDDTGLKGQYILTGSSSQKVDTPHTGTLRISTLKMYPMSLYESGESSGSISLMDLFDGKSIEWEESKLNIDGLIYAICRGGWPQSIDIEDKEAALAIANDLFYQTCHTDVSNISGMKRNPLWTERILRSYSRNICTLADAKTIYADSSSTTEMVRASFYEYFHDLEALHIIDELPAWCPAIRSKEAIRSSNKRNLIDPSIAVAALGLSPEYFNTDFKTLGFLFESLCIRDLRIYSSSMNGEVSYYHDRYGLEADAVLHLKDGRYALIEFKLGSKEIDMGAKHLCEIERLIVEYNKKEKQVPLRLPDLKLVITATEYGYKREDGVYVIPIGCLKD
ncbi:ATP-binding protein [Butyrivibrio hungatei]|uniref:ATPase AAA family n=1 Tax=Butyrivibrio hungatei TaxID=185008 RepID=A0A1D9NZ25_9FIRM|nr:DUF4143 domain-containing protein [Butyrivibrio hungatei]AOZ95523.1 ATPase AAA family [Butyrivibrio hungatei]